MKIQFLKTNLKQLLRVALIMSLPLLFFMITGWFLIPYIENYIREILALFFLIVVIVGLSLFINNIKYRTCFLMYLAAYVCLNVFIKLSFYINYGVKISSSAFFVIFETNKTETLDFLYNYLNFKVVTVFFFCVVLLVLIYILLKKIKQQSGSSHLVVKVLSVFAISVSIFCIQRRFKKENLIINSITSYKDYTEAKANLKANLAKEHSDFIDVNKTSDEAQTHVVVIGESTSNWHMQLYGYNRETNPLLNEIKNELLIFDNVITTNVHTIIALDKILTLSDYSSPNKKENASIVQLANEAGFETFWISNQKPVGLHESIPTLIGNAARNKYFIASDDGAYDVKDEFLLPFLQKALDYKAKKKLVFVHLIGTHGRYKRRYTDEFNVFTDAKYGLKYTHSKAINTVNEYDNAVLYNDFVLRNIIEKVRAKKDNSYVLYFSDHGDEVYDTMDMYGHNEYHGTNPMYEVPFIVWFSEKYKAKTPRVSVMDSMTNRPYMLDDFFHSFSDLNQIYFDGFKPEKSIFNSDFKIKKRLVKKGEDYDKRSK